MNKYMKKIKMAAAEDVKSENFNKFAVNQHSSTNKISNPANF